MEKFNKMEQLQFKTIAALFILLLTCANIEAKVTLPALFADNMVLQQKSEVPVWGWGNAAETIEIIGSWAPQDTIKVIVNSNGKWKTTIRTSQAGGPYNLQIIGSSKLIINNVMLGEVWFCSGQSNMEWQPQHGLVNRDEEIKSANYPDIRFFTVNKRGASYPQDNCEGKWEICSPETMSRSSAIAYFFGRRLFETLHLPVGLVVSAWGGTPAEVWLPKEIVEQEPELNSNKPEKEFAWWPIESGTLYNQMIHPLVPYRMAGTIWYQGESNQDRYSSYNTLMSKLIAYWRKDFGHDFPFYFVQIAPHTYNASNNTPALLREQQEKTASEMLNTGMVVISDLVDNVQDIHPINKQGVGLRLANMALAETYQQKDVKGYQSPTYQAMKVDKNKIIINFHHAENGLVCHEKKITGMRIAGEDGIWTEANVKIAGSTIIVSAPKLKSPKKVSYCFDEATVGNLFSKNGLPIASFRTDRNF